MIEDNLGMDQEEKLDNQLLLKRSRKFSFLFFLFLFLFFLPFLRFFMFFFSYLPFFGGGILVECYKYWEWRYTYGCGFRKKSNLYLGVYCFS